MRPRVAKMNSGADPSHADLCGDASVTSQMVTILGNGIPAGHCARLRQGVSPKRPSFSVEFLLKFFWFPLRLSGAHRLFLGGVNMISRQVEP